MLNQIDDIPACQKQSAKKIVSLVVIISRAFQHLQLSTWYWLLNKNFLLFRELRVGVLEIERDFVQIPIYSSEAFHWAAHNPQMVKPDRWNNTFCWKQIRKLKEGKVYSDKIMYFPSPKDERKAYNTWKYYSERIAFNF